MMFVYIYFDLMQSKKRKHSDIENDASDISGTKVLILANGLAPCNKHIVEMIAVVKPLIRQLVEDANLVVREQCVR